MTRVLPAALLIAALAGTGLVAAPTATGAIPAPLPERSASGCHRTLATYPILEPGDRGRAVRTLQCDLNDVGVGPVTVDGIYGPQTKKAVWRIVRGFEGLPDRPYRINNGFWTLLYGRQLPTRVLKRGDHGAAVRDLQRALRAAGGRVVIDGTYGDQTARVVAAYQRAQGQKVTGTVTEDTRFILGMGGVFGELD